MGLTPHFDGSHPDPSESSLTTSEEAQQAIRIRAVEVLQDYAAQLSSEQLSLDAKAALVQQTYSEVTDLLRSLPIDNPEALDSLAASVEALSVAELYSEEGDMFASDIIAIKSANAGNAVNMNFMHNVLARVHGLGKTALREAAEQEPRIASIVHFSVRPAEELVRELTEINLLSSY